MSKLFHTVAVTNFVQVYERSQTHKSHKNLNIYNNFV